VILQFQAAKVKLSANAVQKSTNLPIDTVNATINVLMQNQILKSVTGSTRKSS